MPKPSRSFRKAWPSSTSTTKVSSSTCCPVHAGKGGLPDSVHFWKVRIEETDPEKTFRLGIVLGPSGCGKSSLIRAGLLPRLDESVTSIYVESTAEETETRLVRGLRKHRPDLPADLDLRGLLATLKATGGTGPKKTLLVLDQFEQWLHARRAEKDTELAHALKECDGSRLQALILVRDDFPMALHRFLTELEIKLREGENFAVVDLFDRDHARKVLAEFGRGFSRWPEGPDLLARNREQFLDRAVAGLAQDRRVISVRLALFAWMVKGKPWTPQTLDKIGGAEGVGVTFLEDAFGARSAPPAHRIHQKAAQAVLKALLPESGSDIKGSMRPQRALLEASGYTHRPTDFDDLIGILDWELRLITPTDPEGLDGDVVMGSVPVERHYQLTHDYLVHSLREWLTRKQRETRRGRAELLLAERASLWNASPENRNLPTVLEWASLRRLIGKRDWTEPQGKMMKQAGRFHGLRGLGLAALFGLFTWTGVQLYGEFQSSSMVRSLQTANTADVPGIITQMEGFRRWANPRLTKLFQEGKKPSDRLHASLALLTADPAQVDFLTDRLVESANPIELKVICDLLKEHKQSPATKLWSVLEDQNHDGERRFRAACASRGSARRRLTRSRDGTRSRRRSSTGCWRP